MAITTKERKGVTDEIFARSSISAKMRMAETKELTPGQIGCGLSDESSRVRGR
jgi:hypothetical protein